jgi:2-polyprenyl-6-methoxyphenol hydroxylase-like FAD-dependent oxidoreductase
MTTRQHYEIVVVGGGLTGVMMAIALSYGGYGTADMPAIALIDRAKQDGTKTGNSDLRTTTIHAAGKAMFEALGIWQYLEKCAAPIACIKIANGLCCGQ